MYLLKQRNDLINYFKGYKKIILSQIDTTNILEDKFIFKNSDIISDQINLKNQFIESVEFVTKSLKLIDKTWQEEAYIEQFVIFY